MEDERLELPDDPADALQVILGASRTAAVLVLKRSPICPISHEAEREFRRYLTARDGRSPLNVAEIDVIGQRPLARGLVAALGVVHESPQVLLFVGGALRWHASHSAINATRLAQEVDQHR